MIHDNEKKAFFFLFGLLILKNLPFWLKYTFPYHDTLQVYQAFHVFYNEYFTNGELCQWLPYQGFGIQSSLLALNALSPAFCLIGAIGLLFRVQDTLFLFNTAIFLQEVVLLVGVFLFARHNFKHLSSVFFVCSACLLSVITMRQPGLNHMIYYVSPLILYGIQLFFDRSCLSYLIGSLFAFLISLLGTCGYSSVVQSLPPLLFFLILAGAHRKRGWQWFKGGRSEWVKCSLLGAGCLVFIAAYAVLILDTANWVDSLTSGRDPHTGKVGIQTFLTYGGRVNLQHVQDLLIPTLFSFDVAIFTGTLTLIFAIWSLTIPKPPLYWALFIPFIVLGLFALGSYGGVARILYYIYPGMKYFRHVRFVLVYFIVLVPLLAGFGFDSFVESVRQSSLKRFPLLVMGVSLMQLGFYQKQTIATCRQINTVAGKVDKKCFAVAPLTFQRKRTDSPETAMGLMRQFVNQLPDSARYVVSYSYSQWDPCCPTLRIDSVNRCIAEYLRREGGKAGDCALQLPMKEDALAALACNSDKLRVFSGGTQIFPPIDVMRFTSNGIELNVEVQGPADLTYSDAWHPNWSGSVNGRSEKVARALGAFKSVHLQPGVNSVHFWYNNEQLKIAQYTLIFMGIGSLIALLSYSVFYFLKQGALRLVSL